MATNMSTDKNVSMCKKCRVEHERPVGSKCERGKSTKDEKRDTSKETTVWKTPRGKGRPKKLKADPELGVAPLMKMEQVNLPGIKSLPRVTVHCESTSTFCFCAMGCTCSCEL